ncbi:MAG: glycosyltransferase family 2 protein [Candidatus Ratteibacteria bacterium]|jgi:glycosyltransferase involved in cell wall biosynthesis
MPKINVTEQFPAVSVIIPTLNRARYLRQCIESALSQEYPNLEVIVVDNGSTDNTREILSSFGNKIRCLKEGKRGIGTARNRGLRSAGGEFIALLDSDDFYLPGKISLSVKKLMENHAVSLVYTDLILVDSEGRRTETIKKNPPQPEKFLRTFLGHFPILPSTTLLRKKCLENTGYFDETLLNCHEDTDMWFRMLKAGYRFDHIPEPLTAYRQHPENFWCLKDNEEPIRLGWDKIRSSAIEYFTVQELFGDLTKNKGWEKTVKREYDKLADTYYFEHLPLSARAAAKKSLEIGRPSFGLLFLNNTLQIFPLLHNILKTAVKLTLANIHPKLTRGAAGKYRKKLHDLFFKLRYRSLKIFLCRYGLDNNR